MRKIPTLFKRVFDGHKIVDILPEVDPSLQWVLDGEGLATIKWDGACCAIIDGKFYMRYDAKNGKPIPENAIKCQDEPDPITGHMPCWVPVEDNPSGKWYKAAYLHKIDYDGHYPIEDGTYEAVGKHFNNNPYGDNDDTLIKHGVDVIDELNEGLRTFEGIRSWLKDHYVEGIVFWKDGEPKCKIKRSDFGFEWNPKKR